MRPFIQKTAGATFFLGISHTLMFRKDYVEIIFKLENGFYGLRAEWQGRPVAPHGLGRLLPPHLQPRRPRQADAYVAEALPHGGGRDDGQVRLLAGKRPQPPDACRLSPFRVRRHLLAFRCCRYPNHRQSHGPFGLQSQPLSRDIRPLPFPRLEERVAGGVLKEV